MSETNEIPNEPAGGDMGRPPINDTPMTPAERQRRRRARLRKKPWEDHRSLAWSIVGALRSLRSDASAELSDATVAAVIDRAVIQMEVPVGESEEAAGALRAFLDPEVPLPARGHGRRGGHHGHRGRHRHHHRRGTGGHRDGEGGD